MIVSLLDPLNLLCCNFTNQLFYAKTATPSLIEEEIFLMEKNKNICPFMWKWTNLKD